jgi:hypothetical protein
MTLARAEIKWGGMVRYLSRCPIFGAVFLGSNPSRSTEKPQNESSEVFLFLEYLLQNGG